MYIVVRSYGRYGQDYLQGWHDRWGTVCVGAKDRALSFETEERAREAKSRAACLLMIGVDGTRFSWSVAPSIAN